MDESVTVKKSNNRKTQTNTKIAELNNNIIFSMVKLLLLNFFITPLLFFLVVALCNETINILSSFNFITNQELNSLFYEFLFQRIPYVDDFKLYNNYVLFYRWIFTGYIVFIVVYNIRFWLNIYKNFR